MKPAGKGQLTRLLFFVFVSLSSSCPPVDAAGTNKQKDGLIGSAKKLDEDNEHVVHKKVTLSLGKTIQQARAAKGMTQKDLAQKINEKPHVVNEYEAGKAIPDQTILGKLERQLGVKLRGKDIGAPLPARGAKKKAAAKK